MPAVERRVLDALGHHRSTGLLEAQDQVPGGRAARAAVEQEPLEQDQLRGEVTTGYVRALGGRRQMPHRLGVHRLARADVRAVDVHRDQQLDQRRGDRRGVDLLAGVGGRAYGHPGQAAQLGLQHPRDHLALGAALDRVQVRGVGVVCGRPHPLQRLLHDVQRVVPRGPSGRPRRRQRLVAPEDLLDDDPGGRSCRGGGHVPQPVEVALRVGEPVGVVDAEAVDDTPSVQVEQQRMGGVEDRVVLDPHRHQGVDVEEPSVGQHVVLVVPGGEQVRLPVEHLRDVALRGSADREDVVVVAQDRLSGRSAGGVDGQVAGLDRLSRRLAEQRQREPPADVVPVDVEPVRGRSLATAAQHLPQRGVQVQGCHQRHVVGHHVDDDAEPVRVRLVGQAHQRVLAAEVPADPGVVDDVVAVPGTGRGLQHRRQVQVRDAEPAQVRHERPGIVETEPLVQLQAVRPRRRRPLSHDAAAPARAPPRRGRRRPRARRRRWAGSSPVPPRCPARLPSPWRTPRPAG